jgi:hypothetical protein
MGKGVYAPYIGISVYLFIFKRFSFLKSHVQKGGRETFYKLIFKYTGYKLLDKIIL